jgi:hypothetical protein
MGDGERALLGQAISIPGRCRPPNQRYASPGDPGGGIAIRLPSNRILEQHVSDLLRRPQGGLPVRPNTLYRLK